MKERKWMALFGIIASALIFSACGGDSGSNGTEVDGGSSSSGEISSSGGHFSSSGISSVASSSSDLSSSANGSSSSAKTISSSSSVVVSSSSAKVAWDYLNPNITYGEMTDSRDGQTYKTVTIGTQTWMAENLNYATDSSWCYGNSADSCSKYGRLYQWAAAMGVSASYNNAILGDSVNLQGACPSGWHVPSSVEWTTLETAVGGSSTAGTALKSTSGWYDGGNGTDSYGFSVLPAGYRYYIGSFSNAGDYANFWSAAESSADGAYERGLGYGYAGMGADDYYKDGAFSVRCLKN